MKVNDVNYNKFRRIVKWMKREGKTTVVLKNKLDDGTVQDVEVTLEFLEYIVDAVTKAKEAKKNNEQAKKT